MAREPVRPHETPQFQNAAEYVVVVTFTVAGGARRRTAVRRAERVAERLANAAAKAAHVLDVTAVTGPASSDGTMLAPRRVQFAAANSGQATYGDPRKLDRYLDPDHERALASLREANRAYRARQEADRTRRAAVGCANTHRVGLPGDGRRCDCVYCRPDDHLAAKGSHWFTPPSCLCGTPTPAGGRCLRHRDAQIVVIDGDPETLQHLADTAPDGKR